MTSTSIFYLLPFPVIICNPAVFYKLCIAFKYRNSGKANLFLATPDTETIEMDGQGMGESHTDNCAIVCILGCCRHKRPYPKTIHSCTIPFVNFHPIHHHPHP